MDSHQRSLLDYIYNLESEGNYNAWNDGTQLRPDTPVTEMTVKDVIKWQKENLKLPEDQQFTAVGAGQIIHKTLAGLVRNGVINLNDLYNQETQDKANSALLEGRGYSDWKSGRISTEKFGNRLSKEWAALPLLENTYRKGKLLQRGQGYHDGVGSNKALDGANSFQALLEQNGTPTVSGKSVVGSDGHGEIPKRRRYAGFGLDPDKPNRPDADDTSLPPWIKQDIDFDPITSAGSSGSGEFAGYKPITDDFEIDYKTPGQDDKSGGPMLPANWSRTFADEFTDSGIYTAVKYEVNRTRYAYDPAFDALATAKSEKMSVQEARYVSQARNQNHYNFLKGNIEAEKQRNRRRQVSDKNVAMFLGAMSNPDSLITLGVPIGFGAKAVGTIASNFVRTGLKSAAAIAPLEVGLETARARYDPSNTSLESAMRVGLGVTAVGLLGGGFGAYYGKQARKGLIEDVAQEIAATNGITRNTTTVNIGKAEKANVSYVDRNSIKPDTPENIGLRAKLKVRGVAVHEGKVIIDDAVILQRFKAGKIPDNVRTPNELVEYEIHRAAAMARKTAEGSTKFETLDGQVEIPFLGKVNAGYAKEAAEEADAALIKYREENNKILQNARIEALARISDSPYKYVHRNALISKTRDLIDLLIADGGFVRGSDKTGLTVGSSVFSRRDTWNGEVDTMIAAEDKIYNKYLGLEENEVGGINVNKSFKSGDLSIGEFRNEVSRTLITGQKHAVPEINEMAVEVGRFYEKFRIPAETYGVMSAKGGLTARKLESLDKLESFVKRDIDTILKKPDSDEYAARLGELNDDLIRIQELKDEALSRMTGPKENYFTRVYLAKAIEENREAFKRQIVMPHMKQQPYIDTWVLGKAETKELLDEATDALNRHVAKKLKTDAWRKQKARLQTQVTKTQKKLDDAPEYAQWTTVKASTNPKAIEARADKFIDDLLQEGDPSQLAQFREAHRPTFGRSRVFDIQNSFLLKDGPNGNGIADFMETDYNIVGKMYVDRMAPAIEMGRTFARPADGVNWEQGLKEAIEQMKADETAAFIKNGGSLKEASDHAAELEIKILHSVDRVINRVYKNPDRIDNRAAMVLKDWSHLAFMGMSALSATTELAALVMRHGAKQVWQAAFHDLDSAMGQAAKAGVFEGKKAGAIMDVHYGAALAGFSETGVEAAMTSKPEYYLKVAANKYFLLNGLASVTSALKKMDLSIRVPDTLEKIMLVADDLATEADLTYLARFGISKAAAKKMADEPMEEVDGMWMANTDKWADENLVRTFRAAIKQGNENTILAATAADKPIIADGVVYLKSSKTVDEAADKMGWEKKGEYWKVQSGLMALPFTFWNYAIAATNKIMLAGLDEPSSQKMTGIAGLLGLSYMVAQIKTDSNRWNAMSMDEKLRKSIEQSGMMGVVQNYHDLAQGTSIGMFGVNPMPWGPKNGFNSSATDAAFDLMGAGPSAAGNLIGGIATGDLNTASWGMPGRNHFAFKNMIDATIEGIERNSAGVAN